MSKRYRSAVTGQAVTKEYADANPDSTYSETIGETKMPPKKKHKEEAPVEQPAAEEVIEETPEVEVPEAEEAEEAEEESADTPDEVVETEPEPEVVEKEAPVEQPAAEMAVAPERDFYDFSKVTDSELENFVALFPTAEAFEAHLETLPEGPQRERAERLARTIAAKVEAMANPQPVEEPEPIVKSNGRKVSVRGFFGSFKNAIFMEDGSGFGVSKDVDDETLAALQADYPDAEIVIE